MPIRSYSMPIRSYFLVIGTTLAAGLWGIGWYLEPPKPPVVAQSAHASTLSPTPVRSPGSSSPVATATTTGQAPSNPAAQPPAAASKPIEPTIAAETSKPIHVAAKPKKRKHIAQRRQPRNSPGRAYADGSPFGYSAYQPQYAYQPFAGFRGW